MYLTNLSVPDGALDCVTVNRADYIERELRNLRIGAFYVISRFDNEAFIEESPLESNCDAFHVYTICTEALAGLIFTEEDITTNFHGYFFKQGTDKFYCAVAVADHLTKHKMRKHFAVIAR